MLSLTPSRASRLPGRTGSKAAWFPTINLLLFVPTAIAVMVLCLLPGVDVPVVGLSDKIEHVVAYATLAILGLNAFPRWREGSGLLTGLLLMGMALEWLQSFVPGRSADVIDLVANAGGLMAGTLLRGATAHLMHVVGAVTLRRDAADEIMAVPEDPVESARPK